MTEISFLLQSTNIILLICTKIWWYDIFIYFWYFWCILYWVSWNVSSEWKSMKVVQYTHRMSMYAVFIKCIFLILTSYINTVWYLDNDLPCHVAHVTFIPRFNRVPHVDREPVIWRQHQGMEKNNMGILCSSVNTSAPLLLWMSVPNPIGNFFGFSLFSL